MANYPLTTESVQQKQTELFNLDDNALEEVAVAMASDFKAWIFENFELTEEQNETYEDLPQKFNLIMGWQASSGIINRDYVDFLQTDTQVSQVNSGGGVSVEGSAEISYNSNEGFSGKVGVKIRC